jgi:hypothetical protein
LNSARIEKDAEPERYQNFFKKIGEVWKELRNDENMSISRVWVVVDKN